jgi:RHS repeat-associated protein
VTNEAGNTEATYGYTAYGNNNTALFTGVDKPTAGDPTAEPYNVYRFNAKRWDQASSGYDMGFRNYSPASNRFLTRDMYNGALADLNLGTNPYTANRYAFGAGNPVSNIEQDGHILDDCARGVVSCKTDDRGTWTVDPDANFGPQDDEMGNAHLDEDALTIGLSASWYLPEDYVPLYLSVLLVESGERVNPVFDEGESLEYEHDGKGIGEHEVAWCLDHGPQACKDAYDIMQEARAASARKHDELIAEGMSEADAAAVANAFQHTYWMARLAQNFDDEHVRELGIYHELDHTGEGAGEALKDFYNNELGISLAGQLEPGDDIYSAAASQMFCYQPSVGMYSCFDPPTG